MCEALCKFVGRLEVVIYIYIYKLFQSTKLEHLSP